MLINEIYLKALIISSHTYAQLMVNKEVKNITWGTAESPTNEAGQTGCLHIQNESRPMSIILHKTKLQMDTGCPHKLRHTEYDRRKSRK